LITARALSSPDSETSDSTLDEEKEEDKRRALVKKRVEQRFYSGRLYKNRKPDSSGIYAYGIVR
jgi:hypothetical protein